MAAKLQNLARKKDVWHLIRRGIVLQLHFDLETTGLERDFAQALGYGDALGDIAGNFIDSKAMEIRCPDRYLPSVKSSLVTRTMPEDVYDPSRMSNREAMCRIAERFEKACERIEALPLQKKRVHFTTFRKAGGDKYEKEASEQVLLYPLLDDSGKVVNDVRYHPERKMLAFRFEDDTKDPYYENIENQYYVDNTDKSKWRFVEPHLLVSGYRIKWADVYWLRANLVRAGFHSSNVFFTHSRATITNKQRQKNTAVDTHSAAMNVHLFGPQGETGLRIGKRVDTRTGESVPSATLERMMEENTRYENVTRGVAQGIFMPDGSVYTKTKAHKNPDYDAMASFALYNHARKIAPDIIRHMELQGDEDELRRFLPGNDPMSTHYPIYAMARSTYPDNPTADPVAFLAFDDQLGSLRRVIMMRLDFNLRNQNYKGKKLNEMNVQDIVQMMREQGNKSESIIRLESVRKWKGLVKIEQAWHADVARTWDHETISDSYQFLLQNRDLCEKVRRAVEVLNWEVYHRPEPSNPTMEEQSVRNGFGNLDYLEFQVDEDERRAGKARILPNKGATASVVKVLYERAMAVYKYHNNTDMMLHMLALQPHPVEYSDDPADLANYRDLLKRVKRKFKEKQCPYYRDVFEGLLRKTPKLENITLEQAREFRWKLMKRFLDDHQAEHRNSKSSYREGLFDYDYTKGGRILFGDLSRTFRVVDTDDRVLEIDYIKNQFSQNPGVVQKKLDSGAWRIQFYRLSSEMSVTKALFQFADEGRLAELDETWQRGYEALKHYYLNGPLNEDPSQHRWQTIPRLEHELKGVEVNAQVDGKDGVARAFSKYASGDADVYAKTDEGQRIIGAQRKFLERVKAANPMTALDAMIVNIHPDTGLNYERIEHEIPSENCVVINVPDAHLRKPIEDIRQSPYSLVIPQVTDAKRKKIADGAHVILQGAQTGRLYYPGPVSLAKAPAETGSYSNYYEQARRSYADDAGVPFPKEGKREILVVQKLEPLAHTRRNINPEIQTIKVPSLFFDGLVCPRLAHFEDKKPFTGLVLPVDYCPQRLEEGQPIRFREMTALMGSKLKGEEKPETGHIYESTLRKAKVMTMQELLDRISNGEINDDKAQSFGFAGAFDLWEKVSEGFREHESPDPGRELVYFLEFDPVDKKSWAYFNPPKNPMAALSYGGQPVPPSSYRWTMEATNENNQWSPDDDFDLNRAAPAPV